MGKEIDLIVKLKFGSHLYGTETPQSDTDYKGVYLPSKEQILLNNIPKSLNYSTKDSSILRKNTPLDVDFEIYSLHYFIQLACEGQIVALDMLHAPSSMIIKSSPLWDAMVKSKHKFYTKNLNTFIQYAQRQASKYGIKGSRLHTAKLVLDWCLPFLGQKKTLLKDQWEVLPIGEHIIKQNASPIHNNLRIYQVCNRRFQETVSVEYLYGVINKFYKAYGNRAKQAEDNKNIDWKAVSHAIRAALQVREILLIKKITFPLREAKLLVQIKEGELDYTKVVAPFLENLLLEIEGLILKSDLPEVVDKGYWDLFIIRELSRRL